MKKIFVVTGASSGFGKCVSNLLLEKETVDEIWLIARSKEKLEEVSKNINVKTKILLLDLTKSEDLKKYESELKKEQVIIKVLINSAGYGKFDHSENLDLDTKLNMIDLNVKAPVSMIDYSLPSMEKGSKIMNIASCAGFQPIPYINDYASTKAFLLSYSRALNYELKYRGIHVLAVCPFWTKTGFFDRAIDPKKKEVVISYAAMYDPILVMKKAVRDLYNDRKDISVYGFVNNFQRFLVRILPHTLIMKIWINSQKLNGTKDIRD